MIQQSSLSSKDFDRFEGNIIVVDLATDVNGSCSSLSFDGQDWLQEQLCNQCAIGFDMEWKPDRYSGSDNHVALIQLANAETALLLRTHRRRHWLPPVVKDLLTDPFVPKICVGYDGSDRRKLESSFGFLLEGVVDLSDLAPRKGLRHTGLKKLAEDFGWHPKKESYVARSDWQAMRLSQAQIEYAAEDAYFTYMLYWKMKDLPDVTPADDEKTNAGTRPCLTMMPGWFEQAIEHRSNGFYCALCNKGPMEHADAVVKHITSKGHRRKADAVGLDEYIGVESATESCITMTPQEQDVAPQESPPSMFEEENCTCQPESPTLCSVEPADDPGAESQADIPIEVGCYVRPISNVTMPPPSWEWHPSTFLLITVDDDVEVLSQEGDWLYGCCGGREGWILRTTVRHIGSSPGDVSQMRISSCSNVRVVEVDVPAPPPDWVWRAADFLTLAAGDSVEILGEESGWLYGSSGCRVGWFPESVLQSEHAQCQGKSSSDSIACNNNSSEAQQHGIDDHHSVVEVGQVKSVQRAVTGPPAGMSPCNFLMVSIGEHVLIEYVEDDWLWGQSGDRRGWIPSWALDADPCKNDTSKL